VFYNRRQNPKNRQIQSHFPLPGNTMSPHFQHSDRTAGRNRRNDLAASQRPTVRTGLAKGIIQQRLIAS
jgi:hypothetical protein